MRFARRVRAFLVGILLAAVCAGIACGKDGEGAEPGSLPASDAATIGASPVAAVSVIASIDPAPASEATIAESVTATEAVVTATPSPAEANTGGANGSGPAIVAAPVPRVAAGGAVSRMRIPSLGVDHGIEVLGVTAGNELDTPRNAVGAIGWYVVPAYPQLATPGTDGAAMFSAHINYNGANGPFANLSAIQGGADIFVTMADGSVYQYQVFAVRGYVITADYATAFRPLIDMVELIYTPARPAGEEWITLMTCSCGPGRIVNMNAQGFGDCVDRDVVVARRVL